MTGVDGGGGSRSVLDVFAETFNNTKMSQETPRTRAVMIAGGAWKARG